MAELGGGGAAPFSIGLRYGGLALRVESDAAGHLDWLCEFLAPAFEVVPPPAPARVVRVRIDPARYAAAVERGPAGEMVPCFWQDSGVRELPSWTAAAAGERLLFDRDARAFYRLNGAADVEVLTAGEGSGVRDALMRVVREMATMDLRRAGGLVLHAAAVAVGDRVLLVAGPKGAGKTTLLVHLLRATGTRFVANDRAALLAGSLPPEVRGLPTIVKLLRSSAGWFPGLAEQLDGRRHHHRFTLAEGEGRPRPQNLGPPRPSFSLSPAQLWQALGARPAPGGRLGAVVFLNRTDAAATTLRRLAVGEAAAALAGAQLGAFLGKMASAPDARASDPWTPHRLPGVSAGPASRTLARCEEVAAVVPAWACGLGPATYADPEGAGRLLAELGF